MLTKSIRHTLVIGVLGMMAAFSANADQKKPTLTIYTYDSFTADWGPGPAIKKAFEQQCDCELKLVALSDGVSLLNRLRMEGNKSKADIILGLDNNLIHAAKETGLFAPSNIDTSNLRCQKNGQMTLLCLTTTVTLPLFMIKIALLTHPKAWLNC